MSRGNPFIWGQRSRSRVTKTLLAWVFALFGVLAYSSCGVCSRAMCHELEALNSSIS